MEHAQVKEPVKQEEGALRGILSLLREFGVKRYRNGDLELEMHPSTPKAEDTDDLEKEQATAFQEVMKPFQWDDGVEEQVKLALGQRQVALGLVGQQCEDPDNGKAYAKQENE